MDSIESKLQNVKTAWQQFYASMGIEDLFKGALDAVTTILNNLNSMSKGNAFYVVLTLFKTVKNMVMSIFTAFATQVSNMKTKMSEVMKTKLETDTKETEQKVGKIKEEVDKATNVKLNLDTSEAEAKINNLEAKVQNATNQSQTSTFSNANARKFFNMYYSSPSYFNSASPSGRLRQKNRDSAANLLGITGDENLATLRSMFTDLYKNKGNKTDDQVFDEFIQRLQQVFGLVDQAANTLSQSGDNVQTDLVQGSRTLRQQAEEAGKSFRERVAEAGSRLSEFLKKHNYALNQVGYALQAAGSAIMTYAMTIKNSSEDDYEKSKTTSGWGTIVNAVGSGVNGALLGAASGAGIWGAIIGAVVGAAPGIFSGVSQLIDGYTYTILERIEIAEDELSDLEETETKLKATSSGYKSALSELETLEEAQYDSAEAMEEYKDKMNSLGETYPEMITGFDSMGNAIIDATNLENLLAEARYDTAKATVDALEKELQIKELEKENAEELLAGTEKINASSYQVDEVVQTPLTESNWVEEADFYNIPKSLVMTPLKKELEDLTNNNGTLSNFIATLFQGDLGYEIGEDWKINFSTLQHYYKDNDYDFSNLLEYLGLEELNDKEKSYIQNFVDNDLRDIIGKSFSDNEYATLSSYDVNLTPYSLMNNQYSRLLLEDYNELFEKYGYTWADLGLEGEYNEIKDIWENEEDYDFTLEEIMPLFNFITKTIPQAINSQIDVANNVIADAESVLARQQADEILASQAINGGLAKEVSEEYQGIFDTLGQYIIEDLYTTTNTEGLAYQDWAAKNATAIETALNEGLINGQSSSNYEQFAEIWDNMDAYSLAYVKQMAERLGFDPSLVEKAYNDSYSARGIAAIDKRFGERTRDGLYNTLLGGYNVNAETGKKEYEAGKLQAGLLDDYSKTLVSADKLAEQGYIARANNLKNVADAYYWAVADLGDGEEYANVESILDNLDLTDIDALTQAREDLVEQNGEGAYDNVIAQLDSLIASASTNISTLAQTALTSAATSIEEVAEVIEGYTSGFEGKDVIEAYQSLSKYGDIFGEADGFNEIFEYNSELGKWVYTQEAFSAIVKNEKDDLAGQVAAAENLLSQVENGLSSKAYGYYINQFASGKGVEDLNKVSAGKYEGFSEVEQDYIKWAATQEEENRSVENYKAYLEENVEDAQKAIEILEKSISQTLLSDLDFDSIAKGFISENDREKIGEAIENTLGHVADGLINNAIAALTVGDFSYFEEITSFSLTSEQKASFASTQQTALSDAIGKALEGAGTIIDEATANIIAETFGSDYVAEKDGYYVVEEAIKFEDAITAILNDGKMTIAQQNAALKDVYDAYDLAGVKSDLSGKTSLTVDDFITLGDAIGKTAQELIDEYTKENIVELNNFTGEYEIIDFDAYWEKLETGLDKGTSEYLESYSEYLEEQIEKDNAISSNAKDELDNLLKAEVGDKVVVAYLRSALEGVEDAEEILTEDVLTGGAVDLEELLKAIIKNNKAEEIGYTVAEVQDALLELIQNWADMLSSGIEGTLSFADADSLSRKFGLDEDAFTQTTEGLKLTTRGLYEVISQMDGLERQAAIESAAKALQDEKEEYNDIFSVMKKIAKIEEELNKESDDERKQLLEAELAIAKEIEQTLKEADDTYNFMSRDVPSGFDDPMSAWEGYSDAIKVLYGEDWSDGRANFEDLYNMFDFIGDDILQSAEVFNNDAITAAGLIEAAADAMKIDADGEMFVDLSELGTKFGLSAESMKKGIDSGIKELAQSQIEMLDAAIKMLETIVAMEELGEIDGDGDGILELGDIFDGNSFTEDFTGIAEKINKALIDAGVKTEEIKIGETTLQQLLTEDWEKLKELDWTQEQYLAMVNDIINFAKNADLDPENLSDIYSQIGKLFSEYGGTEFEIDGETWTFNTDGSVIIKNSEGEISYVDTYGHRHKINDPENIEEEIANIEAQAFADAATGQTDTKIEGLHLTCSVDGMTIDFLYDKDNSTGYYNGKEYHGDSAEVARQIKDDIIKEQQFGSSGTTIGEEITVDGKVYTKLTYATGEVRWQDSDGNIYTNAAMTDLVDKEIGDDTEVVDVPINADLEIASVGEIAFVEGVIPETGVPYNGTIKINPTQLEISAEGFDATVIAQIESYNTALSSLAALGVVSTGVTATATGVEATDTEKIEDYGEAAEGLPASVDSSVTASATIPVDVLNNIIALKVAANALKNNPDIDTTFAATIDENSATVIKNVLTSYGYSNETAELIYKALDQGGTLAAIQSTIDGIEGKDITITVSLEDSAAQSAIEELTEDSTKTVYVEYQPTKVGPETDTTTTGYTVYGIDNQNGNLSRVGVYDSAEQTIEAVTAAIATGTFQDGTFEITEVKSDGSTVTITASAVDLTTGAISLGSSNSNNGNEGGTSGGDTGTQSVGLDLSGLTTGLAELETAAGTAATSISSANEELSKIDSSPLVTAAERIGDLANAALKIPPYGAGRINTLATAISKLQSKTITADVKVNVSVSGPGAKGNISLSNGSVTTQRFNTSSHSMTTRLASAKGNALAGGTKRTLMGELGPELVVSGGRYFTVGNYGAEFVDLANDAIVFNHLQTKRLLSSGSSGRGVPITNERNATSFATGNAMASATAALAQLKQIRVMWQSLLDASQQDLASKAGSGGGGGGGGNDEGAVEYDLERWYNLLRQIEKLEQQITYEQAKRENMRSGYKYVDSLEKELDLLEKQLAVEKELASLQYDYYLKRMEDVNSSAYGKIFTYDEEGLMQYVDGENKGLDALAKLQTTDENGVLKMTAKQQLAYITGTLGVSLSDLKYKSDGTEAETDADKVQVFFDNVDSIMDELDELYDSYHEHAEKLEDLTSSQNEILQEYIDNQISLENKLLQAIEDREQAEIDRLQDEKDALEEATQDYIDGLTDALNKEKNLYNNNQTDEETAKLQRRLAILQRSGGSASEIKSLQDQIDSRLQDAYFQAQQDQIDAIQEASDNQLEKLQTQIDLMTEALEYQKENGLLWNEVYEMMNQWTPEQMLQFIEQYTKSYKENSAAQNQEDSEETLKEAEIWAAKRDKDARDSSWKSYYASAAYDEAIKSANKTAAQEAYNTAYASGGASAGAVAADAIFEAAKNNASSITDTSANDDEEEEISITTQTGTVSGGQMNVRSKASSSGSKLGVVKSGSTFEAVGYKDGWLKVQNAKTTSGLKDGYMKYKKYEKYYKGLNLSSLPSFSAGGDIDFTGLAMVHGSKNNPENILSAEHTRLLKEGIFSNSNHSLVATVEAIQKLANNMASSAGSTEPSIVIEKAEVNIQPGTISNDYDARRAGELALEEMVKIARKTTNRVL